MSDINKFMSDVMAGIRNALLGGKHFVSFPHIYVIFCLLFFCCYFVQKLDRCAPFFLLSEGLNCGTRKLVFVLSIPNFC